ncbi:ArsR/SmtB family transcription factor [Halomarina pelagica]|uniref:ArsR/SmtB family transcription factor n=1 Tax=Halomarina pelagica TaxID=2961599 RepID=UPI0020C2202B|nr:winged helix-turn-helix domain-containing protein [Halomarina sp. BND7]
MSDPDPQLAELLDHLGDGVSRSVLAACASETRSVGELATMCEVSEATIYRRLNRLIDAGLLEERTRIGSSSVSGGKEYRTAVHHLEILLGEEGITVRTDGLDGGEEPLPTFTVFDPDERADDGTRVVDIQLKLPEHLFSEFLTVWAELNKRAEANAEGARSEGDLREGDPNEDDPNRDGPADGQ